MSKKCRLRAVVNPVKGIVAKIAAILYVTVLTSVLFLVSIFP